MLATLIRTLRLNAAVAVFDPLEKGAKAGRPETPERIKRDQPLVQQMCDALGVEVVNPQQNEEADQLIADVLSYLEHGNGVHFYIVSSDKDLAQLVCEDVSVVRPENGSWKVYGRQGVMAKWGVYPEQIPDYLTLLGDAVDGIDGVRGVGEKTAVKLLEKYSTVEKVVEAVKNREAEKNGLSVRLVNNILEDAHNIPARYGMVKLVPRIPSDNTPIPITAILPKPSVKDAIKILGKFNLSDTLAKVMSNTLWEKQQ